MSCREESTKIWMELGVATAKATAYGAASGLVKKIWEMWINYRSLVSKAPSLQSHLERIVEKVTDVSFILGPNEELYKVLSDPERIQLNRRLKSLNDKSESFGGSLQAFQTQAGGNAGFAAVRTQVHRLSIAVTNRVPEIESYLNYFERDLEDAQEEVYQLIVRYQCQLSEKFAKDALAKTRYRSTNEIYTFGITRAAFTEGELMKFNLRLQNFRFEERRKFDRAPDDYPPPLRWYEYLSGQTTGYVLVESKFGPYSNVCGKEAENDSENLRSAYCLVRLFQAANGDEYRNRFNVLSCRGFVQLDNRSILLFWNPPSPITNLSPPYFITLREVIGDEAFGAPMRSKVAKRLVRTVYELLQARWYHRSICLNNVIAFDPEWKTTYLVGFGTARLSLDGHSDPASRGRFIWKSRYFQHPDRYVRDKPSDCRFRMKHDIYGLGVLLLELQKGVHLGRISFEKELGKLDGSEVRSHFVELACERNQCRLGEEFILPIVSCLQGFEEHDVGVDVTCHPRVLREFRRVVYNSIFEVQEDSVL